MEFKFKKGQKVHVRFGEIFSSSFGGTLVYTTAGPGLRIKDRRVHQGEPQYKVESFVGWWNEANLQEVENA
jgi:hypothetical protein